MPDEHLEKFVSRKFFNIFAGVKKDVTILWRKRGQIGVERDGRIEGEKEKQRYSETEKDRG